MEALELHLYIGDRASFKQSVLVAEHTLDDIPRLTNVLDSLIAQVAEQYAREYQPNGNT